MTPKKYLSGTLTPSFKIANVSTTKTARPATKPDKNQMMAVFVLQPKRLIKKHDLKSLTVDGEKRNPHESEELPAARQRFVLCRE